MKDAIRKQLPSGQTTAPPQHGQTTAPVLEATPPTSQQAAAAAAAAPDIEQWSTQLPPTSAQSPYAVLAGMRFEAFSNPCPDGKGRCWVPIAQLPVSGRFPDGQEIHVSYKAGGKPWFVERFRNTDATALLRNRSTAWLLYRLRSGRNQEHLARHTGRIEFEVTIRDPLAGSTRKLAAGHFNVGTAPTGGSDVDYFVNYDWATEVMTVDFMGNGNPSLDYPGVTLHAVFLQPVEREEQMSLHLFHAGKEIASTSRWGHAFRTSARSPKTRQGYGVVEAAFALPNVVAYDRRAQKDAGFFVVSENPGEYTIKILRNGELAREAMFTITPDGRIDRSLNIAANLHHGYTVVRAKVLGTQDGARANFKADGLWGNAPALK
ncbi:hypothetical protein EZ313_04010 [Ramlibacter henchirensis]|uniref:Uncharacterized protein n=1 Tax=Ramlibacter henchirensis TaxID=204072 RepID=A0A4Z0C6V9_9BURK|nr:hypothetical protein [Ramlibacter henchirensis]TFZ05829.1 hypothetical protein EZ313_04010 [Ramlibacter henchirensis]